MKDFLKYTLATIVGLIIAGFVGMILLIGTFSAILSMSDKPVEVKDKSLLIMKFDEQIVERADKNPLNSLPLFGLQTPSIGLDDILKSIHNAKTDDRIRGIYLNPSSISAGLATVEEIRNALVDFKESGKFVYAYGEALSQKAYYLVSAADKIVLNPIGMVEFQGLMSYQPFFKNTLEKLGVEMQIIRHGKFKAAVEPFMLEKMSPENMEQVQTYMGSMWGRMVSAISESRGLTEDELNALADEVMTLRNAGFLKEKGMVDTLMYKDEVINDLKELTRIKESNDLRVIDVSKYAKVPSKTDGKGLARDKIAVIYAVGAIDYDDTGIQSEELSKTIREARRDSTIKAIVLRINSPGGSAYGSEVIWREVKLAAEAKPLIASMGNVAASGGYYIAAAADTIMAGSTTITGSIGVYGQFPYIGKLMSDKFGITRDYVNTNAHSDFLYPMLFGLGMDRRLTDFERSMLQQYVEETYDLFTTRVADGRNMTQAQVDEIGQGRVWSAENAKGLGLVDLYGGVNDAIKLAAEMSGTERYRVVQLPKVKDPFEMLMKELSGGAASWFGKNEFGEYGEAVRELKNIIKNNGIMARMPYNISIE